MTTSLSAPVPITKDHEIGAFDCGETSLNEWLQRRARKNEQIGASRTYVIADGLSVVGYYCLGVGAVGHNEAPKTLRRNMPNPVPVMILGRLAVHKSYQNRGLGSALLRDATLKALKASEIAGISALIVHALSESARRFYLSRGFVESPIKPMTLCLILATLKKIIPQHKSGK